MREAKGPDQYEEALRCHLVNAVKQFNRTEKALIRLRKCAVCSGPLQFLSAYKPFQVAHNLLSFKTDFYKTKMLDLGDVQHNLQIISARSSYSKGMHFQGSQLCQN